MKEEIEKLGGAAPVAIEQKTTFHVSATACISGRMAWKLGPLVHLSNFNKGVEAKMSTEYPRAKLERSHHHPSPSTLAAAISISIATITTIVLPHLVHTCNRASHKASIVRHIAINQSQDVFFNVFFSRSDLHV